MGGVELDAVMRLATHLASIRVQAGRLPRFRVQLRAQEHTPFSYSGASQQQAQAFRRPHRSSLQELSWSYAFLDLLPILRA